MRSRAEADRAETHTLHHKRCIEIAKLPVVELWAPMV